VKQKFPEQQKLPRFESKGIFFKKSNGNSWKIKLYWVFCYLVNGS
jgi:hypothetical protein